MVNGGWTLTGRSGTGCADTGEPARQAGPDWLLYRWRPSRDSALRRADRRLQGDQGHVVIHNPWRGPRIFISTDSFKRGPAPLHLVRKGWCHPSHCPRCRRLGELDSGVTRA